MDSLDPEIEEVIRENERRNMELRREYDPVKGIGCFGERVPFDASLWDDGQVWLPAEMTRHPDFLPGTLDTTAYRKLRFRFDFEYWCVRCVKIKDKRSHALVPFTLNRAQFRLLATLETMRLAGKPVRLILLKARQWGGSTLIQMYMAWWQMVLHTRCHSVISCHFKDASATIKAMYATMLENYPEEYLDL